jgi:hypothetical protein
MTGIVWLRFSRKISQAGTRSQNSGASRRNGSRDGREVGAKEGMLNGRGYTDSFGFDTGSLRLVFDTIALRGRAAAGMRFNICMLRENTRWRIE